MIVRARPNKITQTSSMGPSVLLLLAASHTKMCTLAFDANARFVSPMLCRLPAKACLAIRRRKICRVEECKRRVSSLSTLSQVCRWLSRQIYKYSRTGRRICATLTVPVCSHVMCFILDLYIEPPYLSFHKAAANKAAQPTV